MEVFARTALPPKTKKFVPVSIAFAKHTDNAFKEFRNKFVYEKAWLTGQYSMQSIVVSEDSYCSVNVVEFSPEGDLLLAGCDDGNVRVISLSIIDNEQLCLYQKVPGSQDGSTKTQFSLKNKFKLHDTLV